MLISGGLDSILAARVVKEEGIDVIPLRFHIPFCHHPKEGTSSLGAADLVVQALGQELRQVDIGEEFLQMLSAPRYGYGSNMNPCIDCKILMLGKARQLQAEWGAGFVVTGEVLGQRPMSQHRRALELIEQRSGLTGLLLRPLSAQLLPETIPERQGWLKRQNLLAFAGRGRSAQMALAQSLGIVGYPAPAGGCLLTDPQFSKRLKYMMGRGRVTAHTVALLRVGRFFCLSESAFLVVGRNEKENEQLSGLKEESDYLFLPPQEVAGPTALGRGAFDQALIRRACQIVCRYADRTTTETLAIEYRYQAGRETESVTPLDQQTLEHIRLC